MERKTLKSLSRSKRRSIVDVIPEGNWEGHGDYMTVKRIKRQDQMDQLCPIKTAIFKDVIIFVNGWTIPDADDLKELIHANGGGYRYSLSSSVTHVIASNLPAAKLRKMSASSCQVYKPEWITDSISADKLLPTDKYRLCSTTHGQKRLKFQPVEAAPLAGPAPLTGPALPMEQQCSPSKGTLSNSSSSVASAGSSNFVSEFHSHSRLHHLSTWSNELKEFTAKMLPTTAQKLPQLSPEHSLRSHALRAFVHIDIDCFFVSVCLRDRPELRGKPVGVTHAIRGSPSSMGGAKSDGVDLKNSTSDLASCSYEAREYGVRNGMSVGEAVQKCPGITLVRYDFAKYRTVSQTLYEIFVSYSHLVQAVSCDEAYVELTDYARDYDDVESIVRRLRQDVYDMTGCTASAGISYNMLLARMATRKAKPNGQHLLTVGEVSDYLPPQPVGSLPGIGSSLSRRLEEMGVSNCAELQAVSISQLKEEFGAKTGEQMYSMCRGVDHREIQLNRERKSISVDVNFGIRFGQISEAHTFLHQLADELGQRAGEAKVEGSSICLKMKIRQASAPVETWKYLGHGRCDNISRSNHLLASTNRASDIIRTATKLLNQINPLAADIRGMGLTLSRLVTCSQSPSKKTLHGTADIRTFMVGEPAKSTASRSNPPKKKPQCEQPARRKMELDIGEAYKRGASRLDDSMIDLPSASQLDHSVLLALPPDLQEKIFDEYGRRASERLDQDESVEEIMEQPQCALSFLSRDQDRIMSDFRASVRNWVSRSPDGPTADEVEKFATMMSEMSQNNMEITDLALKSLRRVMAGSPAWIRVLNQLTQVAQEQIRKRYGGKLAV